MHSVRLCMKALVHSPEWTRCAMKALSIQPMFTSSVTQNRSTSLHTSACVHNKDNLDADDSAYTTPAPKRLLVEATVPEPENVDFPSDITDRRLHSTKKERDQKKHAFRPDVDPKETTILLFPGQGSQFVGMGRQLLDTPGVEELYSRASEILRYDLLDLCLNGPEEKLHQTVHCQPAVLVTSLAAVEKLKHVCPWAIEHCITAAGFSVGEYAALVFSGAISYEDAVRVIKVRAEAMHAASLEVPSGMMSVFLTHKSKLKFACFTAKRYCTEVLKMENAVCSVANYLFPECKVVAGNNEALEFLERHGKEFGIPRVRRLPVSGAFHSELMKPAKKALKEAIKQIDIETPVIPVHSNVNGYKHKHPKTIERLLIQHVYEPIRWEQTMHILYSRPEGMEFPFTYEVGPGTQLGQILKRTNKKAHAQYEAVPV